MNTPVTTKESEVDVLAWIDAATVAVGIVADGADTKMKRLAKPVRDAVAEVFEAAKAYELPLTGNFEADALEFGPDAARRATRLRTALRNAGVKL